MISFPYPVRNFLKSIRNLIRWFPIIWKDKDWDDSFIFEILKFKLKNQSEYIGKHDRHVSAKRDAEIMMLCVRLIDKIQHEFYGTEYLDYYESEMKFIDSKLYPNHVGVEFEIISERFDEYFKKYPLIYKKVKKTEKEKIAFHMSRINEERAHSLLFKILEKNIRRWWD